MATLPLDLESVLGELDPRERQANGMPGGTTMGHVHLQVADIPAAERFYNRALGLDVMVRSYPGALFLAAGGYHHHLGSTLGRAELPHRRRPRAHSGSIATSSCCRTLRSAIARPTGWRTRAPSRSGWKRASWPATRRAIACC